MTGTILLPPAYQELTGPVIFLAGPIQGAYDWQSLASQQISAAGVHVASPRRTTEAQYQKGNFPQEMYNEQVDWETHYLRRAAQDGVVLFWLAKESRHTCDRAYAQTTRFELGEWKVRHERDGTKLVVGIEQGFTNAKYIRRRLAQDCINVPVCSTLEESCERAIRICTAHDSL